MVTLKAPPKRIASSKGNQTKVCQNGKWYKVDRNGYEAAAEAVASDILAHSNIENVCGFVNYSLEKVRFKGCCRNACVSEDFLGGRELVTVANILKSAHDLPLERLLNGLPVVDRIKLCVDTVEALCPMGSFGAYLTALLEFDKFIGNDDRHLNNIAVIKERDGGYSLCPIFDNGGGFLSDAQTYGTSSNARIFTNGKIKAKPFSPDFAKQVSACHELFGPQLFIESSYEISAKVSQTVSAMYPPYVKNRIESVIRISKLTNKDMLVDADFAKDTPSNADIEKE